MESSTEESWKSFPSLIFTEEYCLINTNGLDDVVDMQAINVNFFK